MAVSECNLPTFKIQIIYLLAHNLQVCISLEVKALSDKMIPLQQGKKRTPNPKGQLSQSHFFTCLQRGWSLGGGGGREEYNVLACNERPASLALGK